MDFRIIKNENVLELLKDYNYPNQELGVIAHIRNNNNEILLQQRGSKSRDENFLFEDIGGKIEKEDTDFKSAVIREIKEEAGNNLNINIENILGIYHRENKNKNWVFIVFFVRYISGEFKIMEKDKCLGYKFFTYDELMKSKNVTDSCKFLTKQINKI